VRIRSDIERKRLAASRPPAGSPYSPGMTQRTYARLLQSAEYSLRGGHHTIVDAAFLEHAPRREFEILALRMSSPFCVIACEADRTELRRRIAARQRSARDPSDADLRVLDAQLASLRPLDPSEEPHTLRVNTQAPGAEVAALEALKRLDCA
jgi:uncharacterized protein